MPVPALTPQLLHDIEQSVRWALAEDVGDGDITAELIPLAQQGRARVITREQAIVCGRPWVDEVFRQLDPSVRLDWAVAEGDHVAPDQTLLTLEGPARSLLTGERTALNFLQTLSGTATVANAFAALTAGSAVRVLDTRKTIPGLRTAQKYAVKCGGCDNHRMGLYDAFLIKENHIAACGGITAAVATARRNHPDRPVEVEVETFDELEQALAAGADTIMLDEFSPDEARRAVAHAAGRAHIEISGNISADAMPLITAIGPDFVSSGALTKHLRAIDLSMRFI